MTNWHTLDDDNKAAWYKARSAYNFIGMYPDGCTQAAIKRFFGLKNGNFESLLNAMEFHGFLIYQDDIGGRLYTFRNRALR